MSSGAACDAAGPAAGGDSPGEMAVVDSAEPQWPADEGWRVDLEPAVSIGVAEGPDEYQLYRVYSALRLDDGAIVVAETGAHELRFYDAEGRFVRRAGRLGQGPGEFGEPATIRLWLDPEGRLLTTDYSNGRINVFDAEGTYLTQVVVEGADVAPRLSLWGVFGDGSWLTRGVVGSGRLGGDPGTIIEMERVNFRAVEGEPVTELARAATRPRVVNRYGDITHYPFVPLAPEPLFQTSGEHLLVWEGPDPSLGVIDLEGRSTARFTWTPGHQRSVDAVWERYASEALETISDAEQRARYAHLYRRDLPLPERTPAYREMLADPDGNVWLERFRLPWESARTWDVLAADGRWLGTVATPPGLTVYQVTSSHLVGLHQDEAGVFRVRTYRIRK